LTHKVVLIKGDGIGPEVSLAAKECVDATGVKIAWQEGLAGEAAIERFGTPLAPDTLALIKKYKVALKGPVTTPIGTGFRSVNVELRKQLDLYVCLRPCKWYEGVKSNYRDIDLLIFRENTEDLYAGIEFDAGKKETQDLIKHLKRITQKKISLDTSLGIKLISAQGCARFIRFAFAYALKNKRKKITLVHKANIMKYTDGLFLRIGREVAAEYAGKIEFEDKLVDNMCMQLVQKPQAYDCLVLPNLYGDIVSDLCAGLVGGLGVAPGANLGREIAIFEPTHGSAPKYRGMNKVNPVATILSAALMLKHLKEEKAAARLEEAVCQVIREGKQVTYDFKRNPNDPTCVGTAQMAQAIIKKLKKG
jgi:isocitrate dehydrogenase (NAD+)